MKAILLMLLCTTAGADELMLGMWSKHYSECSQCNETHNLVGYAGDNFAVGTYKNSLDKRSNFIAWKSDEACIYNTICFDILAGAITGYEDSEKLGHKVSPMVMPRAKIGPVQIFGVPGAVMAAGFVYKF